MVKEVSGHTEPRKDHPQSLIPGTVNQAWTSRRIKPSQPSQPCSTQPLPQQNLQSSVSFRVSLCHASSVSGVSFCSCVSVSSLHKPASWAQWPCSLWDTRSTSSRRSHSALLVPMAPFEVTSLWLIMYHLLSPRFDPCCDA